MNVRIRDASPADQEFLARGNEAMALETEHKRLDPPTIRLGVAAVLGNAAHGRYFVAEDETGTPVGQLMVTYEWSDWRNGQFWWIQSVYVLPSARRSRVFRTLYDHIDALSRGTPGVIGLRLYVELENVAAQRTYERCGMHDGGYRLMEVEHKHALASGKTQQPGG
jgi:ribosomal protein S18 acetylase RimI-like enzyme